MKRNMDLIKAILKYVEQNDKNDGRHLSPPEFPDYTDQQVVLSRRTLQAGELRRGPTHRRRGLPALADLVRPQVFEHRASWTN